MHSEWDTVELSLVVLTVLARYRVKVALRHTYIILPSVTSQYQRTSDQQDKGVCHFKKKKKKGTKNIHFPSLALTLTLIVILSPNHYTTRNFG